jgi:hypothetical protein
LIKVKLTPTKSGALYDKATERLPKLFPTVTVTPTLLRVPDEMREVALVSDIQSVPSQALPDPRTMLLTETILNPDPSTDKLVDGVPAKFPICIPLTAP